MPIAAIAAVIGGVSTAGAALIGGAATVAGAAISASASIKASSAAAKAAADNNALEKSIYDSNVQLLSPYVDRGNTAANTLSALYGLGGDPAAAQKALDTFLGSTGYQFQFDQGTKAITSQRATAGLLNSGETLKALTAYGQNTARTWFGDYAGGLNSIAQTGENAAGSVAGQGTHYADAVSANNNNAATAAGTAAINSASSINSLLQAGASLFGGRGLSSYGSAAQSSLSLKKAQVLGADADGKS